MRKYPLFLAVVETLWIPVGADWGPCKDGLESQVGGAGSERNGQKPGAYGNQGGS